MIWLKTTMIVASIAMMPILCIAAVESQSVWTITNTRTISSGDQAGNKISFSCYDSPTIHITTKNTIIKAGSSVSVWASRNNRLNIYPNIRSSKSFNIRMDDFHDSKLVLDDMINRYDLSILVNGDSQYIMQFALDGFGENYKRICN